MRTPLHVVSLVAVIAACSPKQAADGPNRQTTAEDGNASEVPPGRGVDAAPAITRLARVSEYSSLGGCRLITSKPEEAGYRNSACPGVGGFSLRLIDSDGRQNLFVKTPSGKERSLRLSQAAGSGFSRIGDRIEWRGTMDDEATIRPDAMVLRYFVVEQEGEGETAYLLPVMLTGGGPCVAGKISPGVDQSERARAKVDGNMACLVG